MTTELYLKDDAALDAYLAGNARIFAFIFDADLRPERQRLERRHFHVRRGIDEGA